MATAREEKMPIRVLARRAAVSTATINFYVQQGLLPPPEKLSRTRALYSEEHLEWLLVIRQLQSHGYSLQLIKRGFEQWGHTRRTLDLIKESGAMQPIPSIRSEDTEFVPTSPAPVTADEFIRKSGLSEDQVHQLGAWGILRPRAKGQYDVSDLELAAMVKRLLEQGIALEALAFYRDFIPIAERFTQVGRQLIDRNLDALRRRQLRMRDLSHPLARILDYLIFRIGFELYPTLREELVGAVPRDAAKLETSGPDGGTRHS